MAAAEPSRSSGEGLSDGVGDRRFGGPPRSIPEPRDGKPIQLQVVVASHLVAQRVSGPSSSQRRLREAREGTMAKPGTQTARRDLPVK